MTVGLCGAHRTGKTTLAREFAKRHNLTFVETSASEVFKILDRDPKADYGIEDRIVIQEAILYAFERQYAHANTLTTTWIADRTPIDMASYLLADIRRETFHDALPMAELVNDYVHRCIEATNRWFGTIVLLQPGIQLVEATGKAPACPAYVSHINQIQKGLLLNEALVSHHYVIPSKFTELEDRISALNSAVTHALDRDLIHSRTLQELGISLH